MSALTPAMVNELERVARDEAPVRLTHEHLAELCNAWRRLAGVFRDPNAIEIEEL